MCTEGIECVICWCGVCWISTRESERQNHIKIKMLSHMWISNWLSYRVNDTRILIHNNWLLAHHNKSNIHFSLMIVIFFFNIPTQFSCVLCILVFRSGWYGTAERAKTREQTRERTNSTTQNDNNNNNIIKQHITAHTASTQRASEKRWKKASETTEIKTIVMCVQMCAIKIVGRRPSS